MKKADKFDPAKWLVENKITFQSKLNEAQQVMINGKKVDLDSLELDGVSPKDEISDAYARDAKFTDGTDLNDEEIDEFNKNYIEIVQKMARNSDSLNGNENSSQFPSWYDSFLEQLSDEFGVDSEDLPFEMVDPHLMGVITHDFSQSDLDDFPKVVKAVLKRPEFKGKAIMAYDNKVEGGIQDKIAEKYPHLEDYLQDDEYYYIFIK